MTANTKTASKTKAKRKSKAKKKTTSTAIATRGAESPTTYSSPMPAEANGFNAMIEKVAQNPDLSVEKLNALLDMQMKVMDRQAKMEFDAATAKFRQLARPIRHNRKGQSAGATFTYADYPRMEETISPWLAECGLSFKHTEDKPETDGHGKITLIIVYCHLSHASGHTEKTHVPAIPDYRLEAKQDRNQIVQRARTYAKRQSLADILGLSTQEDKQDSDDNPPPPEEVLTEDQAANIHALLDEVAPTPAARAARERKVLTWIRVERVEDIPKEDYERVVKALEAARAKVQA